MNPMVPDYTEYHYTVKNHGDWNRIVVIRFCSRNGQWSVLQRETDAFNQHDVFDSLHRAADKADAYAIAKRMCEEANANGQVI